MTFSGSLFMPDRAQYTNVGQITQTCRDCITYSTRGYILTKVAAQILLQHYDPLVVQGAHGAEDLVEVGVAHSARVELGERPALWIPGSSISEARLEAVAGEETVDDSRSLVSSPLRLRARQLRSGY